MNKISPAKEAQNVYDRLQELKEQSRVIHEEIDTLQQEFFKKYQDYEFPIIVDSKEKFFRVYEINGRFVYNSTLDSSTRVKPVKVFEEKK